MLSNRRQSCARHRNALIATLVIAAWGRRCAAQAGVGHVDERVISATDTILFVLDPRGRALLGLRLFQDAAARLGWIVMSSYNTLSDGPPPPPDPNVAAMNAMLAAAVTIAPIEGEACALLREALSAATAEQRGRLGEQCYLGR